MTVEDLGIALVVGLGVSWVTMHAVLNMINAVNYIMSGMPGIMNPCIHVASTLVFIAYFIYKWH